MKENSHFFLIFLLFALFFADLLVKYKIRHDGGFYICNSDFSWNINLFNSSFWLKIGIISFFCVIFYLLAYHIKNAFLVQLGFVLILAGGLANLTNRLWLGCIIDFFKVSLDKFPLFNLADVYITTGCIFILMHSLLTKRGA